MSHSFVRVYIHLVWHTKYREPVLEGRLEEFVLDDLREQLDELDLVTTAVNAAWDHVHLLAGWKADRSTADVVHRLKGGTAYRWNQKERRPDEAELGWQRGYGAVSVSPDRIDRVVGYIDGQKRRHREGTLIRRYECVERRSEDDGWEGRW